MDSGAEGLAGFPFRQIVESLREVVWLSDAATGQILYITPNCETLWGLSREAVYGDPQAVFQAAIHPDDRERVRRLGADDTEYRFLRPDGSVRWVRSRALPVQGQGEAGTCLVGVSEDVTERRLVEEQLQQSRQHLDVFVEHAPASLAMFDRDMRYLFVSERWARSNGFSSKDLVGRLHYELFPGTPEHVREVHAKALAGEPYRCDEERFVRKDGSEYWLHWEVHPWHHKDNGAVAGIIVFTENITERKRSQALMLEIAHGVAAKTGTDFFHALADNLSRHTKADWVTLGELVQGGRYLRDVAKRTRGLPISRLEFEITGRPCEAVLQRRHVCVCADDVAKAFPHDPELARYGMRAFAGVPLFGEQGEPIGVVSIYSKRPFEDPAEVEAVLQIFASRAQAELLRLKHEREILELNATLEQRILQRTALLEAANRDLEAFSYSVSHDLRAPLRAIGGYLSMAAEDGPLNEPQRQAFDKVMRNVKRMNELINELIGLAQVDRHAMHRVPIDLGEIAADVIATLRERDVGRVVTVDVQSAPCLADPKLMRIVLENLLGNAWKFTSKREDACIRFATETGEDDRPVHVVQDNGAGFDAARASRLFQPFQRLHSASEFEGTGIGLATVERIIRRHGGRIWADAKPGEGAIFRFTLGEAE